MKEKWILFLIAVAPSLQGVTFVGSGDLGFGALSMAFNEDNTQIANGGDTSGLTGREFTVLVGGSLPARNRFGIELTADLQPGFLGPVTATASLGTTFANPNRPPLPIVFEEIERNIANPITFEAADYLVNVSIASFSVQYAYDRAPLESISGDLGAFTSGSTTVNVQGTYSIAGPLTTLTQSFDVTSVNNLMEGDVLLEIQNIDFPNTFEIADFSSEIFNIDEPLELFDEVVDGQRFNHFLENSFLSFGGDSNGTGPIVFTAIPEPSSVLLLSGALLGVMGRRKR